MTFSDDYTAKVRAALSHIPRVEEKKMFGGLTFMVNGKMCISVGKDRLMCRIDPELHDAAVKRPGCRTVVMKGRTYKGYVHVDEEAVKAPRDFKYWIGLALDHNATVAKPGSAAAKRRR
jgi:TfoX/Sxy family transcriptional regulator of competence genes